MNVNWKPESDRPALDETKTGRAGLAAPEATAAAADHPRRRGGPREMRPDREPLPPAIRAKPGQKTTTKADLIKAVYRSNPALSHVQAKNIYETAIEEISAALIRGEIIKLSRFGVFSVHAKGPRVRPQPAHPRRGADHGPARPYLQGFAVPHRSGGQNVPRGRSRRPFACAADIATTRMRARNRDDCPRFLVRVDLNDPQLNKFEIKDRNQYVIFTTGLCCKPGTHRSERAAAIPDAGE